MTKYKKTIRKAPGAKTILSRNGVNEAEAGDEGGADQPIKISGWYISLIVFLVFAFIALYNNHFSWAVILGVLAVSMLIPARIKPVTKDEWPEAGQDGEAEAEEALSGNFSRDFLILYKDPNGEITEKYIIIKKLILKGDKLYIHAFCHRQNVFQLFSEDRIVSMKYKNRIVDIHGLLQQREFAPAKDMDELAIGA